MIQVSVRQKRSGLCVSIIVLSELCSSTGYLLSTTCSESASKVVKHFVACNEVRKDIFGKGLNLLAPLTKMLRTRHGASPPTTDSFRRLCLGVYMDCGGNTLRIGPAELTMKQHVAKIAAACFYHIRRLRQVRYRVGQEVTHQLVLALIISRLDYCNSVLATLPTSTLQPLPGA